MQQPLRETAEARRETPPAAAGASRIAPAQSAGWQSWARNLGVSAVAGVFLALVGAMNTGGLPLSTRLIFWLPLMLGGSIIGAGVSNLVLRMPMATRSPWLFGVLLTVILAFPITALVWMHTKLTFGLSVPLSYLPSLFGGVLVICAAMTTLMILVSWPGQQTHAPPEGAAPTPVRFLERLPGKLKGAALYAVSAEDHYLRLHTSKGSDLILMRLTDAIAELKGLEGAQTHRSWWVARDAVESARREGDKMVLVLKGGAEAPVSRPNVRPLREAGWY